MSSQAPERLGPYRILRPLGQGGMGSVYAATEESTGESVAVKVLAASLGREEGFRERFQAEIESLRKLRHPNIVRLIGYGEENGYHFYAMELVDGASLEDELRRGRIFNWREALEFGLQICRALRHAHDRGVIHRDVKPANLLVAADRTVKLSDFGIAKLFGNSGMTSNGGVLGTADYMSPEQAEGRPVTHRCDLYSLGGVLYALVAGRPPFQARSIVEMLHLQRYADPDPVRRHAPRVPGEFEDLLRALLQKEPERRVPTALVAGRRLEEMRELDDEPVSVSVNRASPMADTPDHEMRWCDVAAALDAGDQVTAGATIEPPRPIDPKAITSPPPPATSAQDAVTADRRSTGRFGEKSTTRLDGERRYTAVRPFDEDDEDRTPEWSTWISPQTWGLIVGLLMTGGVAWYLLQPPTADTLYQRIISVRGDDSLEHATRIETDVQQFLALFPRDPRCGEVERIQFDIDRRQLQRKMERFARRIAERSNLTMLQTAYVEAIRFETIEPVRCRDLLRAIVDVYGVSQLKSDEDRQCLELARQKVVEIERRLGSLIHPEELRATLDELIENLSLDPEEQRRALQQFLLLYEGKPGAEPVIAAARRRLEQVAAP